MSIRKSILALTVVVMATILFITGCGPTAYTIQQEGNAALRVHELETAQKKFTTADSMYTDQHDKLLFQLDAAMGYLVTGQDEMAYKYFAAILQALKNIEDKGEVAKGFNRLKSSKKRMYVPTDHEKLMIRYLYACLLYKMERYDEALIELKQLKLRAGEKAELPETEMMMGLCYYNMRDWDDAAVSFQYVISKIENVEIAYYYLVNAYKEINDKATIKTVLEQYHTVFGRDMTALIKRYKETDPKLLLLIYAYTQENKNLQLYADDMNDNLEVGYYVGSTVPYTSTGEVLTDVAVEVGCACAREYLSGLPFMSLVIGSNDDDDNRYWYSGPLGFGLAFIQTDQNAPTVTLVYRDKKKDEILFTVSNTVRFGASNFDFYHVSGKLEAKGCGS